MLINTLVILIVLAVLAVATQNLVRRFLYPPPVAMPPPVETSFDEVLRRFEAALATHAPRVLDGLQPGLTEEAIAELGRRYRLPLTDELRALYRWRNGFPESDQDAELIPGHRMPSLEETLNERARLAQSTGDQALAARVFFWLIAGYRSRWVTVLDDGCGDGYFYDPARRRYQGSFFFNFAEIRMFVYFPTLANFLAGATECFETGIYRGGPPPLRENHDRSEALWAKYAGVLP